MLWLFLINSIFANPTPINSTQPEALEIIVEAHKDFEVYVEPVKMDIQSVNVEAVVAKKTIFTYSARYAKNAKVKNERNSGYESVTANHKIKVYDEKRCQQIKSVLLRL